MRKQTLYAVLLICGLGIMDVTVAVALNERTHEIVNEQAARQSGLDQILNDQLGFAKAVEEPVRGREGKRLVFQWIREGGRREDDVGGLGGLILRESRFFRHFHDPPFQADGSGRGPWGQAGLKFLGQNESSIRWMQRLNQDVLAARTGNFSWQDARKHYRTALISSAPDKREEVFADMFRALGQIMHLVVDASVPLHVRNDEHPLGSIFGNYEHWVQAQHGRPGSPEEPNFINTFLSNPFRFDTSILQQPTNDSQAPVPVARLIDTDTYRGSDPNVTLGTAIGIAEFTNANFFSEDTGDGQYPFPNVNTLRPTQRQTVQTARIRAYYTKAPGDGVPVDPVLAECVLDELAVTEVLPVSRIGTCTDENVWAQVAQVMLPRAVGYAGGVLDYFFRGTVNFTVSESGPDRVLTITNTSSETMQGKFTLHADNFSDVRSEVSGAFFDPLTLGPGKKSPELTFTPPSEVKYYILVFEGRLGNLDPGGAVEDGAVAGRVKPVPTITSIEPPTSGFAGDLATLVGQGFDPSDPANNIINFAGLAIPAQTVDPAGTMLTFIVPDVPPPGPVTITSVNPSVPPVQGGTVTITGTNFVGGPAPLTVTVGGSTSDAISYSSGGANRVMVTVLTQFDTPILFQPGQLSRLPITRHRYQPLLRHGRHSAPVLPRTPTRSRGHIQGQEHPRQRLSRWFYPDSGQAV